MRNQKRNNTRKKDPPKEQKIRDRTQNQQNLDGNINVIDPAGRDILPEDANDEELDITLENPDEEEIRSELTHYTEDQDVIDDFTERQTMNEGSGRLLEKLNEYTMTSPEISAGDVDAAWEDAEVAGEETLSGTAPTPDQDVVDDLGEAAGITYELEEPLNSDKLNDRDRNRWELNPESAEDQWGMGEEEEPVDDC